MSGNEWREPERTHTATQRTESLERVTSAGAAHKRVHWWREVGGCQASVDLAIEESGCLDPMPQAEAS